VKKSVWKLLEVLLYREKSPNTKHYTALPCRKRNCVWTRCIWQLCWSCFLKMMLTSSCWFIDYPPSHTWAYLAPYTSLFTCNKWKGH